MKLAWHIARKDLFRLRFVLLLWAGVLMGRMAFALIQSRLDTAASVGFIVPAWIFGILFLPLLTVGMTMGALADDSVCDTDAFWITRPIVGRKLLAAKLLVLGLLSLFPALVSVPWWLTEGYNFGQVAAAAVHTIKWQLIIMVLAAPVAALSKTNGRFVMNAILTAVAGWAVVMVDDRFATGQAPAEIAASIALCLRWLFALWAAATAAILCNQFFQRHTRRSLAIVVAALLLGFGVAAYTGSHPTAPGPVHLAAEAHASRPARVLARVAPVLGARSFHDGHGIRVTDFIPNDPRGTIITVSESVPDFSDPKWIGTTTPAAELKRYLFDHEGQQGEAPFKQEAYFLVHRHDGRSVRGTATPVGETLTAATLSYFRRDVVFSAPRDWTPEQALDFPNWVAGAELVKVGADDELHEFPQALNVANFSALP